MARLDLSVALAERQMIRDLSSDSVVEALLSETHARRRLLLSDLHSRAQVDLVVGRCAPMVALQALVDVVANSRATGRTLTVKWAIERLSPELHIDDVTILVVANRLQRMGHRVVVVLNDVVSPDVRAEAVDAATGDDLDDFRARASAFCALSADQVLRNHEWLEEVRLPWLLRTLSAVVDGPNGPDGFGLPTGSPLPLTQLLRSVVRGLDSSQLDADVELGAFDELPDMEMAGQIMALTGRPPPLVVAVPALQGVEALSGSPEDLFAQLMTVPDRMAASYLRALTEWTDPEIALVEQRLVDASLSATDLKRILAGDVVAAVHGLAAAMSARTSYANPSASPSPTGDPVPVVSMTDHSKTTVGAVLVELLGFTSSLSAGRRLARQNGLRIIVEQGGKRSPITLRQDAVSRPLGQVVDEAIMALAGLGDDPVVFIKAGRQLARLAS